MSASHRRARRAFPGLRHLRPLALLVLGIYTSGCATQRVATLAEVTQRNSEVRSWPGLPIRGYTDARSVHHELTGFLRLLDPDSLEITIRGERYFERVTADLIIPAGAYPDTRLVVPRDSVVTVCYEHVDGTMTAIAVLGIAALVVAAVADATAEAAARGVAETLGELPPIVP